MTSRSRVMGVTHRPDDNSASGSSVKRCVDCSRSDRQTKETVRNGLNILRVRYGLPYCELPDIEPSQLGRYHQFLLGQGKDRPSVPFPRCQGILGENGLFTLKRLCRRQRWELALSLSSISRSLPKGCLRHSPSMRSQWEANAFSQPPPTSPEYLTFVRTEVTRIFRPGWDKEYARYVGAHMPNASGRLERQSRADQLWKGQREEFINKCTQETDLRPLLCARYKEVQTAGKVRPLVIYDRHVDLLAPLHKLAYAHLRKTDWLLCGPPTDKVMTSLLTQQYQTSVDLVAASDGLCHDVAETILDAMFFPSMIPRSLRRFAKASLSPEMIRMDGTSQRVSHGQMMGSYLSFPLLCIQSYLAARWASRDCLNARILVNGDDCVTSADRYILASDYPPGFRLNEKKTIRAKNVAEFNSTAFLKTGSKWTEVRSLRRGGGLSTYSGMMHMANACRISPAFEAAFVRARIGRRWGFLPSQLGFVSYPSFLREKGMLRTRHFTELPARPGPKSALLRWIPGRKPSDHEACLMLSHQWANGREGGMKNDVFEPSHGSIRRTYQYRSKPAWRYCTFVAWRYRASVTPRGEGFFYPVDEDTEEESGGLMALDLWRQAFDSLALEREVER